jgi:hypothetical protein
MAINRKRFQELDALIRGGYGDMKQDDIPDEVLDAVEAGEEVPFRGPNRDTNFWRPIDAAPVRPPPKRRSHEKKKRVITQSQRDRINARARARWNYRPPRKIERNPEQCPSLPCSE